MKAWNDLHLCNATGKYYKPVEQQVELIREGGFCDEMAYTAAGTHLESCKSCHCDDDKDIVMKNFLEVIKHIKQSGKNMQEGGQYTNTQICCHIYRVLLKRTMHIYVNSGIYVKCPVSLGPGALNRPSKSLFQMKRISHLLDISLVRNVARFELLC